MIIVDGSLVPLLAAIREHVPTVEHVIVVGDGRHRARSATTSRTRSVIAAQPATYEWPEIDEDSAAAMCYTTGTTGDPKGVVYSHRADLPALLRRLGSLPARRGRTPAADRARCSMSTRGESRTWRGCWAATLCMPDRFLQPRAALRVHHRRASDIHRRRAHHLHRHAAARAGHRRGRVVASSAPSAVGRRCRARSSRRSATSSASS